MIRQKERALFFPRPIIFLQKGVHVILISKSIVFLSLWQGMFQSKFIDSVSLFSQWYFTLSGWSRNEKFMRDCCKLSFSSTPCGFTTHSCVLSWLALLSFAACFTCHNWTACSQANKNQTLCSQDWTDSVYWALFNFSKSTASMNQSHHPGK